MVGVVLILSVGATALAFVLVVSPPSVAPQSTFDFDFTNNGSADSLVVEHDYGKAVSGDSLWIVVRRGAPASADGQYRWNGSTIGGNATVRSGSTVRLDPSTIGDGTSLDLDEATVSVVWRTADDAQSATLGEWQGPDTEASTASPTPTPTPDPSDPGHAYVDENGNGVWDPGVDAKIDDAEVTDGVYDAGNDALMIPDSVGPITATKIDYDGAAVTVEVDLTATGNQDVTVRAGSGDLVIEHVTVDSKSGRQITLRGETGVRANGTTIDSGAAITVKSNNGEVHLSDASIDATEKSGENVQLTSNGDLYLESTTIVTTAGGEADASLQVESAILYVDGASIDDDDDTLTYSPDDITVDGNPSSGSVTND